VSESSPACDGEGIEVWRMGRRTGAVRREIPEGDLDVTQEELFGKGKKKRCSWTWDRSCPVLGQGKRDRQGGHHRAIKEPSRPPRGRSTGMKQDPRGDLRSRHRGVRDPVVRTATETVFDTRHADDAREAQVLDPSAGMPTASAIG